MKTIIRPIFALALMTTLLAAQLTPVVARADDAATTSDPAAVATTSSDTITSTSASSSSQESAATTTTEAASTSAATSTSDITIAASSTLLEVLSGSSTVSQVASDSATSSASGFIPTQDSTTSDASDATASSTPDTSSTASSTPENTAAASSTLGTALSTTLSAASSTQTIVTGSSVALANILNLLNASFVNSTGSILFANLTDASGTIDLRDGSLFSGLCGAIACGGVQGLQINLVNDAHIANEILVNANSGQNQIENASSSAAISTGNAYAGLNLINLANVSLIDSNYMIVTLNAFQDVNGDIIFPALQAFLNSLGSSLGNGSTSITNAADVTNNVAASAQSGDNSLTDIASTSAIVSGSSTARLNIFNQINSLLMGNGISVLLNFGGAWSGEIQGLVPGVTLVRTPTSVLISGDAADTATDTSGQALGLDLTASSTATINNQASVEAQTGSNAITDASSTALISTGNAFSGANIINVANQTVIGRNWLLAIVNVFGNFNGNIDFGRPDLWVGDSASVPSFVQNGSDVTYTITVTNKGDAPADDTQVTEQFDAAHLTIATSTVPFTTGTNGAMIFSLGTIAPGATQTIVYDATVQNTSPGTMIANTTNATESETDNNTADNTDGTTITANIAVSSGGGGSSISFSSNQSNTPTTSTAQTAATTTAASAASANAAATISVTRTTSTLTSAAGGSVTETIQVHNTGTATAENVSLNDTLSDPTGTAMHTENFDIGELVPGDGVEITYVFNFADDAPSGAYTLSSSVSGDNIASSTQADGSIILTAPAAIAPTFVPTENITAASALITHHALVPTPASATSTNLGLATSTADEGIPRDALVAAAGTIDNAEAEKVLLAFLALVLISLAAAGIYRRVRA